MSMPRHARGFALPVVILLALVAGIVAAVVLQSQGDQRLVVERELHDYQSHHFERGVREVVGSWTDTLVGQPIKNLISDDGHVLDLTTPDGFYCAVYLFDGQGSVLTSPAGLNEQDREDAGGVLDMLGQLTGDQPDPADLRPVGPAKVCLTSAPEEVLEAVAAYASGPKAGQQFAQSIIKARSKQDLAQSDVETAMNAAEVKADERTVLQRLITIQPELWAMVVDVYDPRKPTTDGTPTIRYLGRFVLPGQGSSNRQVSLQSLGKFLSWEELPVTGPMTP